MQETATGTSGILKIDNKTKEEKRGCQIDKINVASPSPQRS